MSKRANDSAPIPRERWLCPPGLTSLGLVPRSVGHFVRPAGPGVHNPWWRMDAFGLLWIPSDHGVFTSDRCPRHTLPAGTAILLLPGIRHRYGSLRGFDYEEYSVIFDGPWPRMLLREGILDPARPTIPTTDHVAWRARMQAMTSVATEDRWHDLPPLVFTALHELLWRPPSPGVGDDPLRAVAERLRRDPALDWDLHALAHEIDLPWSTFRQRFSREIGQPPLRFLLEERVRLAARLLLAHPQEPIATIAARSGYADVNHFGRIFRRAHGMTPTAFRRSTSFQ